MVKDNDAEEKHENKKHVEDDFIDNVLLVEDLGIPLMVD